MSHTLNDEVANVEAAVDRFEQSWRSGRAPQIEQALLHSQIVDVATQRELLSELAAVDLEYRWRSRGRRGPLLEQYVKRLPLLAPLDALPVALIAEEYRHRQRFGDRPPHAEYAARFPRHGQTLVDALRGVDADLLNEYGDAEDHCHMSTPSFDDRSPGADTRAPLDYRDYAIRRLLGRGGMSRVYTAVQKSTGRAVAMKVLNKSLLHSERSVRRFLREARIAAQLDAPGIVNVYGVGRLPDGGYFLTMRLIDGHDLSHAETGAAIPQDQAARCVAQISRIVDGVHRRGYLHCDLKPSNVLLDSHQKPWLTDFAMAQPIAGSAPDTDSVIALGGTYAFMAPEQLAGEASLLSPATDVFGLGGVLYFLLTGDPPRQLESSARMPVRLPPVDSSGLGDVDEPLREIVVQCLSTEPDRRIRSAFDVASALERLFVGGDTCRRASIE